MIDAPPLTPAELADLERQLGRPLPEDYARHLTSVSAGVLPDAWGPYVVARGDNGRWEWRGECAEPIDPALLAKDFAPTDVGAELERVEAEEPDDDEGDAYEAWFNRRLDIIWAPRRTQGMICIADFGCGERLWLVVTGPLRGRLWYDARVSDGPFRSATDEHGEPLTFAAWADAGFPDPLAPGSRPSASGG